MHVFEDFSTVDVVSGGRAEIIVGRGAFVKSFALFGFDLADYDALFSEKLELLLQLNAASHVTWEGRFRPPLKDAEISPRPLQPELPIWVGTGGNPESAAYAARLGLPLTLANISLPPARLAPQVADYKRIGREAGHAASQLRVSLGGHMHIEEDSGAARKTFYPYYAAYFASHAPSGATSRTYRARNTTSAPRPMVRSSSAARSRSSTRFPGSTSSSATSAIWRRSISAASLTRWWRGRLSCWAEKSRLQCDSSADHTETR